MSSSSSGTIKIKLISLIGIYFHLSLSVFIIFLSSETQAAVLLLSSKNLDISKRVLDDSQHSTTTLRKIDFSSSSSSSSSSCESRWNSFLQNQEKESEASRKNKQDPICHCHCPKCPPKVAAKPPPCPPPPAPPTPPPAPERPTMPAPEELLPLPEVPPLELPPPRLVGLVQVNKNKSYTRGGQTIIRSRRNQQEKIYGKFEEPSTLLRSRNSCESRLVSLMQRKRRQPHDCVCDCPPCNYWLEPVPECIPAEDVTTPAPVVAAEEPPKNPCDDPASLPTEAPHAPLPEAPLLPVEEELPPKIGSEYEPKLKEIS